MFIRQKKNKSGGAGIQIVSKHQGKYKVEKTIGSLCNTDVIEVLVHQARCELNRIQV
jgi:hypothetical protein